MKYTSEYTNI